MIQKRKESGFTLIELMIVIAVIGILAVVLVPKVGTIKTQARSQGIETNMKVVEGYVQSKISYWADQNKSQTVIASDIASALTSTDASDKIKNPFYNEAAGEVIKDLINSPGGSAASDAVQIRATATSNGHGTIVVIVPADDASGNNTLQTNGIEINGLDQNGNVYSTVTIKP